MAVTVAIPEGAIAADAIAVGVPAGPVARRAQPAQREQPAQR